jgi:hypothetical protein
MFFGLVLLVVVGTTMWVGVDASKRDWGGGFGTATWVVGCIVLWIVMFPIYLVKRGGAPLKDGPASPYALSAPPDAMYRECPYCKEAMRRDAEICPHCRQPSAPWRFHEGRWWFRPSEQDAWLWLNEPTGEWHEASITPAQVPDRVAPSARP